MLQQRTDGESPPSEWVLTDFSELSRFDWNPVDTTFSLAAEAEPDLGAMRPIERIEREVITERRLGKRTWVERRSITIIRNVAGPRPAGQ